MRLVIITTIITIAFFSCKENRTPIKVIGNSPASSPEVVRVVDGDTIYDSQEKKYKRLLCIDAPETEQTPWGLTSAKRLKSLITSKNYTLETLKPDRYGRDLVLVNIGNKTAQEHLVKEGLAYVYHELKNDCPIYYELVDLENDARSKNLGVWSDRNNVPPWIFRRNKVKQY